ncbi:bacteriocin fulvocin C-related protein [Fodinicola feengrottensis]|nr:bacteriocin fulvocin C-related protein [Fodinicola feengrottensis]
MILTGRTPAFAEQANTSAQAWVAAHRHNLPAEYDEVISYSMAYRKAIYQALPASARSRLWVTQIDRYRASHPSLTAEQSGVLDRVRTIAATEKYFSNDRTSATPDTVVKNVEADAERVLGRDQTRTLLATLGPAPAYARVQPHSPSEPDCNCSVDSPYCGPSPNYCSPAGDVYDCHVHAADCGFLLLYYCDGTCIDPV